MKHFDDAKIDLMPRKWSENPQESFSISRKNRKKKNQRNSDRNLSESIGGVGDVFGVVTGLRRQLARRCYYRPSSSSLSYTLTHRYTLTH